MQLVDPCIYCSHLNNKISTFPRTLFKMESFLDFWVRLDFWERLDFWVREADGRPAGQRLDIYSRGTYAYVSRRYAPYSKVAADPHVRSGLRPRVKAAVEEELSRKHRRSTRKALVLHRTVYQAISASRRCEVRAVADQRGPRAAVRCSSEELGHYVRATLGSTIRALREVPPEKNRSARGQHSTHTRAGERGPSASFDCRSTVEA